MGHRRLPLAGQIADISECLLMTLSVFTDRCGILTRYQHFPYQNPIIRRINNSISPAVGIFWSFCHEYVDGSSLRLKIVL